MKKTLITTISFAVLIASLLGGSLLRGSTPFKGVEPLRAADFSLAQKIAGRILLQVQSHGEAWYVNPADQKRYFLGRPMDALTLMTKLGIGITTINLEKISLGLISGGQDDDGDGINNVLEKTIGTDPQKIDSDNDGYNDKLEIENNYNPRGAGKLPIDTAFSEKNRGKIFLQIQSRGEAWYVNPLDNKRYFLGRPTDAFTIMKNFGLGISDADLSQITIGSFSTTTTPSAEEEIFYSAANAIMAGDISKSLSYFTQEMQTAVAYTLNFLDMEGRFNLGNIMAGAKLVSSTSNEKIYSTTVYCAGYTTILNFRVKKQSDGKWLLTNLN